MIKLMSMDQAAQYLSERGLQCTARQVRVWVKAGDLRGKKWRGHYLVTQAELDRLLASFMETGDNNNA